jgi:hypothetical protein
MSVDRTDYIVYGWKLPYKLENRNGETLDLWDDKFLPYIEGHKDVECRIISDGMCGDYTVFGVVLNSGGDQYEGWKFEELNIDEIDKEGLEESFESILDIEPTTKPTMFLFSHFT